MNDVNALKSAWSILSSELNAHVVPFQKSIIKDAK